MCPPPMSHSSAVQSPYDLAGEGMHQQAGCGGIHDVHGRVQRRGEPHDDADADHERRVSAVDGDLVRAGDPQHLLDDL